MPRRIADSTADHAAIFHVRQRAHSIRREGPALRDAVVTISNRMEEASDIASPGPGSFEALSMFRSPTMQPKGLQALPVFLLKEVPQGKRQEEEDGDRDAIEYRRDSLRSRRGKRHRIFCRVRPIGERWGVGFDHPNPSRIGSDGFRWVDPGNDSLSNPSSGGGEKGESIGGVGGTSGGSSSFFAIRWIVRKGSERRGMDVAENDDRRRGWPLPVPDLSEGVLIPSKG